MASHAGLCRGALNNFVNKGLIIGDIIVHASRYEWLCILCQWAGLSAISKILVAGARWSGNRSWKYDSPGLHGDNVVDKSEPPPISQSGLKNGIRFMQ